MISASTINEIINYIYYDKQYEYIIKNMINSSAPSISLYEDIKNDLIVEILESKQNIVEIYNRGQFLFWFARMAQNQIKTLNGKVYHKYTNPKFGTDEFIEVKKVQKEIDIHQLIHNKDRIEKINLIINKYENTNLHLKRNFYIFKLFYFEDYSVKMISKKTKINRTAVYKYLKDSKNFIKTKIRKNLFN